MSNIRMIRPVVTKGSVHLRRSMTSQAAQWQPMTNQGAPPLLRVFSPEASRTLPMTSSPLETPEGKLQWTPELAKEIEAKNAELESSTPEEILRWSIQRFAPKFTMATAFGPEGMVILHMLSEIERTTPVFNLDTGYQFKETLELREEVLRRYGMALS